MKGLVASIVTSALAGKVCEIKCKITGTDCPSEAVEFAPLNLTVLAWDKDTQSYKDEPAGFLEAHALPGTKDDWQMYLHGPMIRPRREMEAGADVPPFYVSATWMNEMYRFENIQRSGRGQPIRAQQKRVAKVIAPSTSFAIEDADGNMTGMLVAEGQPFLLNEPLTPSHTELNWGGVEYIGDHSDTCTQVFPNKVDPKGSFFSHHDVVNTVSCHPGTNVCFFTVWRFFDDSKFMRNKFAQTLFPDCLHYCVFDGLDEESVSKGCIKGGVVEYETGERVCSKEGVGAVHGMTVAHTDKQDPSQFDIFLVMTGGAQFVGGESSVRKVRVQKDPATNDVRVLSHQRFGDDLFVASVNRTSPDGMAPLDAGGDHAWPDDSGKYMWLSTFRYGNSGVHMLDYETGELIYSVHGMDKLLPHNYAYSAGIHGVGTLGQSGSTLLTATSACTAPKTACAPIPYNPLTKALGLEAIGIMYIIDLSELLSSDSIKSSISTVVV
jgi:hypothetical protein